MTEASNSPSDCSTPNRPFLVGFNPDLHKAVLFRPRCKLWSCPYCAEMNRNLWAVRAYMGTRAYQDQGIEISFLTLTSHEKLTPQQALWVFPKAWKKLAQRARRASDQFSYIMIPEKTERGVIHVHAIETAALGKTWWKKNARGSGLGFQQDETEVRQPQGAAAYVVKYIGKSLEVADWPGHFHRVRTSRDWPPLPEMVSPPGWQFEAVPNSTQLDEIYKRFEMRGYEICVLGSAAAWELIDPHPTDE